MDPLIREALAALPPLATARGRSASKPCKVCGNPTRFFDVTDFWKGSAYYPFGPSGIPVAYHRCNTCGFMFAPLFDDWSEDDFRKYIYNDEYLAVDGEYAEIRPRRVATHMAKFLAGFEDARLVDYGSGTGQFAARMRAGGFRNVTSFDPFSAPVRPSGRFDIITCFEVIEHTPTPLETLQDIASLLNDDGCVVLGESLQPPDIDMIRCNWWYCMPRNGHISLYTDRALAILAMRSGMLFHPGGGLHAFSHATTGRFSDLARRVSLPLLPVSLGAPQSTDKSAETTTRWHAAESFSGMPTRWSAKAEVSWHVEMPAIRSMIACIRIPFANEVRPGFAGESRILVDGVEVTSFLSDRSIAADVKVEGRGSLTVTLRTPPVVSPSALRNSTDHRKLGLAIQCLDTFVAPK